MKEEGSESLYGVFGGASGTESVKLRPVTSAYHFSDGTISRPAKPLSAFLQPLLIAVFFLTACPNTAPTPPSITNAEVEVAGTEYTNSFALKVEGRGFGISRVAYSQGEGSGTADSPNLAFRLMREGMAFGPTYERGSLNIVSSNLLRLQVDLASPLTPGRYGVELLESGAAVASEPDAFNIDGVPPPMDGGPIDRGPADADGGPVDEGMPVDMGNPVDMGGDGGVDMGPVDMGTPVDMGPPDTGVVFPGNFTLRQQIVLNNTAAVPADVTIRITVPHAQLVALGQSTATGLDLMVYQGIDPLPRAFADRVAVNTDGLELVFRLMTEIPVGGGDLYLYYGDVALQVPVDETVFNLVERFSAQLSDNAGNPAAWNVAEDWQRCDVNRPSVAGGGPLESYCYDDNDNNAVRSLATPRVTGVVAASGPEVVYEFQMWFVNGGTLPQGDDGFYIAYHNRNDDFSNTTVFPMTGYRGFLPNTTANIDGRMIPAWLDNSAASVWQRITVRFVSTIDDPSFHLRHISGNDSNIVTVAVDDWWVRKAWLGDDNGAVTLGVVETR